MTETAGMLSIGTYGENSDDENDEEALSDEVDSPSHPQHHHNNTNNNNTITPPGKDSTEAVVAVDNISDDEIRPDSEDNNNNSNNAMNSVKSSLLDFKDNRSDDGAKDYKLKKAKRTRPESLEEGSSSTHRPQYSTGTYFIDPERMKGRIDYAGI